VHAELLAEPNARPAGDARPMRGAPP
jgi:hypothetical protein